MGSQIQIRKPDTKGQPRRGIYLVPSLFTVGTLVCGYIAILSTLKMEFDYAAKAIGWGALFDILDGRIARLTHSTSDFGQQFDSLADVITFGVAPAFLAFAWGVRPVEEVFGTQLVQHLRVVQMRGPIDRRNVVHAPDRQQMKQRDDEEEDGDASHVSSDYRAGGQLVTGWWMCS